MIVVSGTKRSGTSMWMQVLRRAGLQSLGEAFPRGWDRRIAAANPRGFFESDYRNGIYYRTNPHPESGLYLAAEDLRQVAIKVFAHGVVKTERAYLDRLIICVRPWRAYAASLQRLRDLEAASARDPEAKRGREPSLPPPLGWWEEHLVLMRDVHARGLDARWVGYDEVLANPAGVVPDLFAWLGTGDANEAVAAIDPSLQTQRPANLGDFGLPAATVAALDALEAALMSGQGADPAFAARAWAEAEPSRPEIAAFRAADARRLAPVRRRNRPAVTAGEAHP
jgi:hypothetical protein